MISLPVRMPTSSDIFFCSIFSIFTIDEFTDQKSHWDTWMSCISNKKYANTIDILLVLTQKREFINIAFIINHSIILIVQYSLFGVHLFSMYEFIQFANCEYCDNL